MRGSRRSYLAVATAAVLLLLLVSLAPATADRSRGDGHKRFSALIFSKTAAFRHTECIPQGTVAIAQMAARRGFEVDATENAAAFTDETLAKYDVVIFLCTTGDVLNADQQGAFERYIARVEATPAFTRRPTRSTTGRGTADWSERTSATTRASPA